jgi:hypothetical protein
MSSNFSTEPIGVNPDNPFVDRQEELDLVKRKLDEGVKGNQIKSGVICFWGAFGMGKSWLLHRIEHDYHLSNRSNIECSHPPITARLDLSRDAAKLLWKENRVDRILLVRELWSQFTRQSGEDIPEFERKSPDEWAKSFVNWVSFIALDGATPIILLDTVDELIEADESMFNWLETSIVEPLALTDRVLQIFTSRGEIRSWKCFQVRRRVDSHRLSAFNEKNASASIKAAPHIGNALYRISHGHPFSTARLANTLKTHQVDLGDTGTCGELFDTELLKDFLKSVINKILEVLPEELRITAWMISVLRWVSLEPLRYICEKTLTDLKVKDDAYYLDELIGKLQAKYILYWNSEKNYYEMDSSLRKLMAYGLQLNEPELFYQAHEAALDYHRDHLRDYPSYLSRYVSELAFHMATTAMIKKDDWIVETFTQWWNEFLAQEKLPPVERWSELAEDLMQDEELEKILPNELFQMIKTGTLSLIGT